MANKTKAKAEDEKIKKGVDSEEDDDLDLDDEDEEEEEEEETGTEAATESAEDSEDEESEEESEEEGADAGEANAGSAPSAAESAALALTAQIKAVKIEGKPTDFVAVDHFHPFHRGIRERVFSKRAHGKHFENLAKSFAVANPKPNTNSFGMILPAGVKRPKPEKNLIRYVSANEAAAIEEANRAELAAIDARRDAQYRKGDRITP